jgi:hypothetical protein
MCGACASPESGFEQATHIDAWLALTLDQVNVPANYMTGRCRVSFNTPALSGHHNQSHNRQ